MNTNELQQVLKQAQKIGIYTGGELRSLCRLQGWETNNEIINGINKIYCQPSEYRALAHIEQAEQIMRNIADDLAVALGSVAHAKSYYAKSGDHDKVHYLCQISATIRDILPLVDDLIN
jgi:hypothetical protein